MAFPGNAPSMYNHLSVNHVHPAGEGDFAFLLWNQLHRYGFVERQFALDAAIGYGHLGCAGYLDLPKEGDPRQYPEPELQLAGLESFGGYLYRHALYPRLGPFLRGSC